MYEFILFKKRGKKDMFKNIIKKAIVLSVASAALFGGIFAVNGISKNNTDVADFSMFNENLKESGVEQNWGLFFAKESGVEQNWGLFYPIDDLAIGVSYGTSGDTLPPAPTVNDMFKSNGTRSIRIDKTTDVAIGVTYGLSGDNLPPASV